MYVYACFCHMSAVSVETSRGNWILRLYIKTSKGLDTDFSEEKRSDFFSFQMNRIARVQKLWFFKTVLSFYLFMYHICLCTCI